MVAYYILLHDFNTNKVRKHDIMQYLIQTYKDCKEKRFWWTQENPSKEPISKTDYIYFVKYALANRYCSRCEYEWLMIGWPPGKTETLEDCQNIINNSIKIDAFDDQIEPNLEIITDIFIYNLTLNDNLKKV